LNGSSTRLDERRTGSDYGIGTLDFTSNRVLIGAVIAMTNGSKQLLECVVRAIEDNKKTCHGAEEP
jgi:hypothetical protein